MTTSQAPSANFATAKMTATMPVATAPKPLMAMLRRQPGSWRSPPVPDHAGLRERDRGEHADRIERDERLDPAAERRQDDDREDRQRHDPGAEREALTAEREPAAA